MLTLYHAPALFGRMLGGEGDARAQASYAAAVDRLEKALARGPYLMGAGFSAVDVMAGATVALMRAHLPPSAAIDAYVARIGERPARLSARAKDTPALASAA